jgi:DNA mismatch endonuclease, patch repair protein
MPDHLSKDMRSWNMSRIQSKDTKPEKIVRSLLHRLGYRFRLHCASLPGKPDILLPKHRAVIFVHGCFWHRHRGCRKCTTPSSNLRYWNAKFLRNVANDKLHINNLKKAGWRVLVLWECETTDSKRVIARLKQWLG